MLKFVCPGCARREAVRFSMEEAVKPPRELVLDGAVFDSK